MSEKRAEQIARKIVWDTAYQNPVGSSAWFGEIYEKCRDEIRAALAAEDESGWRDIKTAPSDTTKGDFLIGLWNSQGDCCWVQLVRNPTNHHGMSIASHWMPLSDPVPPKDKTP